MLSIGESLALLSIGECWQVSQFRTLNMKVQVIVTLDLTQPTLALDCEISLLLELDPPN